MKLIAKKIVLSACTSLLLIFAWPPSSINFLLLIAFVPLLIVTFDEDGPQKVFLYFYFSLQLFLLEMHLPLLIEGRHIMPLVVGLIFVPAFWCCPILVSTLIKKRYGLEFALIAFPFLYVSQEIGQYYWDFAVTWFHLGLGLSNTPFLLGVNPYLGQEGGSLLVLLSNVSFYYLYIQHRENQLRRIHFLPISFFCLIVLFFNFIQPQKEAKTKADIAIFQPSSKENRAVENDLRGQYDLLENAIVQSGFKKADLLICPESYFFDMKKYPLIVNNLKQHLAIKKLMELSQKYETPIFAGAVLVEFYYTKDPPTASAKKRGQGDYYDIYNGSIFITPDGQVSWRTKQSLVPFTEIIPFHAFFNFLERNGLWPTRYIDTYGTVEFEGPYEYGKLKIAPAICFESLFPHVMASYIQKKANLQVVLSTDWTGSQSLNQQQQDGMLVDVYSFGRPLVFATLNQNSTITNRGKRTVFSHKDFDVKSVDINIWSGYYTIVGVKPWYWIVFTLAVIFGILLVHKKTWIRGSK
ncbi:MAG: apolipoprotein N-acyltransferase [Cyclobacteriaceae bacterium]